MKRILPVFFFLACNAPERQPGNDLGPYEFVAPMDIEPVYKWGDDMATEYADSLEEARIQDSKSRKVKQKAPSNMEGAFTIKAITVSLDYNSMWHFGHWGD